MGAKMPRVEPAGAGRWESWHAESGKHTILQGRLGTCRRKVVLAAVYEALTEKGYNPVNQIVGYIMSGDPTYITSHQNARSMIMKVERDELVEELLTEYIRTKEWE